MVPDDKTNDGLEKYLEAKKIWEDKRGTATDLKPLPNPVKDKKQTLSHSHFVADYQILKR